MSPPPFVRSTKGAREGLKKYYSIKKVSSREDLPKVVDKMDNLFPVSKKILLIKIPYATSNFTQMLIWNIGDVLLARY